MKTASLISVTCLIASLWAPAVKASVIDFEAGPLDCTGAPIVSNGFQLSSNGIHCLAEPVDNAPKANNGTRFLIEGGQSMVLTSQSGAHFSVTSLDLGNSYYTKTSPNSIRLTGWLGDGSSVVDTVTTSDIFQTYVLHGFDNLVSLQLEGPLDHVPDPLIDYYALDNIVIADAPDPDPNGVPEPGTLSLMALSAGLLAWRRRNRG